MIPTQISTKLPSRKALENLAKPGVTINDYAKVTPVKPEVAKPRLFELLELEKQRGGSNGNF